MRYFLILTLALTACSQAKETRAIPKDIHAIAWDSGSTGTINGEFRFSLRGHKAPSLKAGDCHAEYKKAVEARHFMTLLTQDISTVKVEKVLTPNADKTVPVVISQAGHDVSALGVKWGHLKRVPKNTTVKLDWCRDDAAEKVAEISQ